MPHPALILATALLGADAPAPALASMPTVTVAHPMQADTLPPQVRDPRALRREIDRRYPRELFVEGVSGTTVLRVLVTPAGSAESVSVDRSSGHPRLDEAATAAVRTAVFSPATHRGQAVAATLRIPVTLRPPASGETVTEVPIDPVPLPDAEAEAGRWNERAALVERHRLAQGAFERAQAAYREAIEALEAVGERWTPLRAGLQEAEAALEAARVAEEPFDEETLYALEEAVAWHRAELEPLESVVVQRRARLQLALEDVRERAAALRQAEVELRDGTMEESR